jgi:hypothetical protein
MNPRDAARQAMATLDECCDNHAAAVELARQAINPREPNDKVFEFRLRVHDLLCGVGWYEC